MLTLEEMKKRIADLNEFVATLVPEIRERAFVVLELYGVGTAGAAEIPAPTNDAALGDEDAPSEFMFFSQVPSSKPAEAAMAIAAYWYSQYGTAPFTKTWVEAAAARVGLTIPARVDMTYRQARRGGKLLFAASKGFFTVTVHGEMALKDAFAVKKGTRSPEPENPT